MKRALVTGAGGFIGHHLVRALVKRGYWVRGVDLSSSIYDKTSAHAFDLLDLRESANCIKATERINEVYHLAADMGGIGYISSVHAAIARNNVVMNAQMLEASRQNGIQKFLFSSSACVYPQSLQGGLKVYPLAEADAFPALPEEGYGWEKLFGEKLCEYYAGDYGLDTKVVRLHNVYGPLGTFQGGKEKAPAALCRKIALASQDGEIEVWSDGKQLRSFMYISDCIEGMLRIMQANHPGPINLGTDETVSINTLVKYIAEIAGKCVRIRHILDKPQGVRARTSDNRLIRDVLGWEPDTPLKEGLRPTYGWIRDQLKHGVPS